jgi:hypothetical protein
MLADSTDWLGVALWFSGIPFETKAGLLASAYKMRSAMDEFHCAIALLFLPAQP